MDFVCSEDQNKRNAVAKFNGYAVRIKKGEVYAFYNRIGGFTQSTAVTMIARVATKGFHKIGLLCGGRQNGVPGIYAHNSS